MTDGKHLLRVYHRTHHATAILAEGFRDSQGAYMTDRLWSGVWVSADWPLDVNEGANGDVVLELEIPAALFAEFEWVEEGKTYREAMIPAAKLNGYRSSLRRTTEAEEHALWLKRHEHGLRLLRAHEQKEGHDGR